MEGFDLSTIQGCYVGSTPTSAIYIGSNLIWPTSHDYSSDYLTFDIVEAGNVLFENAGGTTPKTISYSTDNGSTWTNITSSSSGTSIGDFVAGDKILFKGENTTYAGTNNSSNDFKGTAKFNASGNIMSLIYGDNFIGQTSLPSGSSYNFLRLLSNSKIIDASNLILPATTLTDGCYASMFNSCSFLTTAPVLPASMLKPNCYSFMFYDCTALTTAPLLPAPLLTDSCYKFMFYACTNLNYVKCLAQNISATDCTDNWLNGVSSTGTFVCNSYPSWPSGVSGIPEGWTIEYIL